MSDARQVLVLGGGLAGLAAACTLLEQGRGRVAVRLVERGHVLGGKASSMPHRDGDATYQIDHGLHVYFQYPNFDRLLERYGGTQTLRPNTHRMFVWRRDRLVPFRSWPLPSPLHFLGGLDPRLLPPKFGLPFLRLMLAATFLREDRLSPEERARLDAMSFEQFGASLGLPEALLHDGLYQFFERSGFHTPHPASALAILRATRLVAQSHAALRTRYLDGPLGVVCAEPLQKGFVDGGGELLKYSPVRRIDIAGGRVLGIDVLDARPGYPHGKEKAPDPTRNFVYSNYHTTLADPDPAEPRKRLEADEYIVALPPRDLIEVLSPDVRATPYFAGIDRIGVQKTIAYQAYYDRVVTPAGFTDAAVAVPGAFSTVFDRARLWTTPDATGSVLEWVSEIGTYAASADADLVAEADRLAEQMFPAAKGAKIVKRYFHRGGHDVFTLTMPGSDAHRPKIDASPIANLTLAGDFTNNAFGVVCMEGAVVSGIEAANVVLRRLGLPPAPIAPMAEPGGLVPALRAVLHATGTYRRLLGYAESDTP